MEASEVLAIILAAAAPVGELRVAIPLAVVRYDFAWHQGLVWALVGNMIPVLVLPWALHRLGYVLIKFPRPLSTLLMWRTNRLASEQSRWFQLYGPWALVPFVAVPLPFTGAWTGCLLAWAIGLHPRRSMPLLALGVVGAGIIVISLTELGVTLALLVGQEGQ